MATLLTVADTLAILGSGYVTYDAVVVYSLYQNLYLAAVVFIWVTTLFIMNFSNLYRYETATHPLRHLPTVVIALVTSFFFLLAAAFSIKLSDTFSRLWLGYFAVTSGAVIILFRVGLAHSTRAPLACSRHQAKLGHCGHW